MPRNRGCQTKPSVPAAVGWRFQSPTCVEIAGPRLCALLGRVRSPLVRRPGAGVAHLWSPCIRRQSRVDSVRALQMEGGSQEERGAVGVCAFLGNCAPQLCCGPGTSVPFTTWVGVPAGSVKSCEESEISPCFQPNMSVCLTSVGVDRTHSTPGSRGKDYRSESGSRSINMTGSAP